MNGNLKTKVVVVQVNNTRKDAHQRLGVIQKKVRSADHSTTNSNHNSKNSTMFLVRQGFQTPLLSNSSLLKLIVR